LFWQSATAFGIGDKSGLWCQILVIFHLDWHKEGLKINRTSHKTVLVYGMGWNHQTLSFFFSETGEGVAVDR
jgi:hypothetical protein